MSSGKVPDTHSVGAICNQNLGVFTVTEIAMENTGDPASAPAPQDAKGGVSGVPKVPHAGVPLTCLARLAARQEFSP